MITQCPKCEIDLEIGIAIKDNEKGGVCRGMGCPPINADTLEIVDCLKCPKCGYSDDAR